MVRRNPQMFQKYEETIIAKIIAKNVWCPVLHSVDFHGFW